MSQQYWQFVNFTKRERTGTLGEFWDIFVEGNDSNDHVLSRLVDPEAVEYLRPVYFNVDIKHFQDGGLPASSIRTTFLSLPPELHALIFDSLSSYEDVLLLGCTCKYLWNGAQPRLRGLLKETMKQWSWAGDKIAIVGEGTTALPTAALVSDEEDSDDDAGGVLEEGERIYDRLQRKHTSILPIPSPTQLLSTPTIPTFTTGTFNRWKSILTSLLSLPPAVQAFAQPRFTFPPPETMVLRNLSTREYIRRKAIADACTSRQAQPNGNNVQIGEVGLIQCLMVMIAWSARMPDMLSFNPSKGRWAAGMFDVTTIDRVEGRKRRKASSGTGGSREGSGGWKDEGMEGDDEGDIDERWKDVTASFKRKMGVLCRGIVWDEGAPNG